MTERKVTNEGLNTIRQLLVSNIDEVAVGTGDTSPSTSDTALDNEVYRDASSNEVDATGRMLSGIRLGSGDANGTEISELMLFTGGGADSFGRLVFSDTTKSSDIELVFETKVEASNK